MCIKIGIKHDGGVSVRYACIQDIIEISSMKPQISVISAFRALKNLLVWKYSNLRILSSLIFLREIKTVENLKTDGLQFTNCPFY